MIYETVTVTTTSFDCGEQVGNALEVLILVNSENARKQVTRCLPLQVCQLYNLGGGVTVTP